MSQATITQFMLPQSEVESFKKFCMKIQKNVPGMRYSIGTAYDKVFRHQVINTDGRNGGIQKQWHTVCDVEVELPADSGWRLIAEFDEGMLFPVDPKKELVLKNPAHGKQCNSCDICGHSCKRSYLIVNDNTGEELQVGSECAKKFGLKHMEWISKFTRELVKIYDYFIPCTDTEEWFEMTWNGPADKSAFAAIAKTCVICAAKAYYDEHPKWIAGYYEGSTYVKSRSNINIQQMIIHKDYKIDLDYCEKVCQWVKEHVDPNKSEFSEEMVDLANSFYSKEADAVKAYFMVKGYETWLKEQSSGFDKIDKGAQVKVSGEIVAINHISGYYGDYDRYTIRTPKGYLVTRNGKIPVNEDCNGTMITSFYAIVEYCKTGELSVGRALKNAKKGIDVIEL